MLHWKTDGTGFYYGIRRLLDINTDRSRGEAVLLLVLGDLRQGDWEHAENLIDTVQPYLDNRNYGPETEAVLKKLVKEGVNPETSNNFIRLAASRKLVGTERTVDLATGHLRMVHKGTVFSTRDRAGVVLEEFDQVGVFPPRVVDFAGVTNVSNTFSSELLTQLKQYCEAEGQPLPELHNMTQNVKRQVMRVMELYDGYDFPIFPVVGIPQQTFRIPDRR